MSFFHDNVNFIVNVFPAILTIKTNHYRNAILNKEKGEVTQSLSDLIQLMEKVKKDKSKYVPDFPCR